MRALTDAELDVVSGGNGKRKGWHKKHPTYSLEDFALVAQNQEVTISAKNAHHIYIVQAGAAANNGSEAEVEVEF